MKTEVVVGLIGLVGGGGLGELYRIYRSRRKNNAETTDAETNAIDNQNETIMSMSTRVATLAESLTTLEVIHYQLTVENAKYKELYGDINETNIDA